MKKIYIFILSFLLILQANFSRAEILSGNVNKEEFIENSNIVVDGTTGNPVSGAKVSIPMAGFFAKTNSYGQFKLDTSFKGPTILSVQAEGYKPFSLTLNENKGPLKIEVTKLFGNEIVIDNNIHHLGDDDYSEKSSNAMDFKLSSENSFFSKKFFVEKFNTNSDSVLKIGTIIGLDTKIAHRLDNKNKIHTYSSPMRIYINSKKIGEIRINGDNQEIPLPKNLIKPNSFNTIRIETGTNQQARTYLDYDDMEFMNLMIVF